MLEEIQRFVQAPGGDDELERLALAAFAYQFEAIEPFRNLCRRRGAVPGTIASWREIPAVPVGAFASFELAAAPAREIFRSSGTTGTARSTHYHPFPDLYRSVIDIGYRRYCSPQGGLDTLSLVPSREQIDDSSLGFMVDRILAEHAGAQSLVAMGARGVDARAARSWLSARQRSGAPIVVLTTSFALLDLLDGLERLGLRFRLPAGSVLFDTGGTKGRTREVPRDELIERVEQLLGLPAGRIVREYGMTELTSHFYTATLDGGDPDRFIAPPWTRVRILDPETLSERRAGETGLICVFDLANLGSAVHLLTEDLGVSDADGFRLVGRADASALRGCSLTVEELAKG